MTSEPKFYIEQEPWRDSVAVHFRITYPNGSYGRACPVGFMLSRPGDGVEEDRSPMMRFDGSDGRQAMQSLMDALWAAGVRPGDIGTPGHLEATKAHLKDMRAIVSKSLSVPLP